MTMKIAIDTIGVFYIQIILWLTNLSVDIVGITWSVTGIPDEVEVGAGPVFVPTYLCIVVVRNGSLTACEDMDMPVAKMKKSDV